MWQLIAANNGDKNALIYLPQQSINPPIHGNAIAKNSQYPAQQERFKQYVYMNSVPTGREERGKPHYLIPYIRRIKIPEKPGEDSSVEAAERYNSNCLESLGSKFNMKFNTSHDCLDELLSHVLFENAFGSFFRATAKVRYIRIIVIIAPN